MSQITLSSLLKLSLAAYRLANLIVLDDGPGDIFYKLRRAAARRASLEQIKNGAHGPWQNLATGLHCALCVGVWMALVLVVLAYVNNSIVWLCIDVLAVAGAQSLLFTLGGHDAE